MLKRTAPAVLGGVLPRYTPDEGKAISPDCGHRYERPGEHKVNVTAH
ncbi:hypothetical protein ACH4OV_28865 [Streptomyces diastaticus]